MDVYNRFTDLVVAHYKENRNVNYYAALLDYDQQYFTKLFIKASGGVSPLEWIQQYVVTQAKLLMDATPKRTIKESAPQVSTRRHTRSEHPIERSGILGMVGEAETGSGSREEL